jgi:pimeloyl-ACP methyl ester carboxylesterase
LDQRLQPNESARTGSLHLLRLVFRGLLVLLFLGLVIFFIIMPVRFGIAVTTAPRQEVGAAPEGFTNVTLTTADGVPLAAWYTPPRNSAVIVLLHGAWASREAVRPYALMLAKNGFGVLAFDQRGEGESGGATNLYGWEGGGDVAAAMQFLSTQKDINVIGGLGLSLGGEVLLGAASANPAMKAIVTEGATYRSMSEYRALPSHADLVQSVQPWVTYTTVRLLTGQTPPTSMVDSIKGSPSTHFLFIAVQDTPNEVEYADVYADAAPGRAEQWIISTGGHIGGFTNYPDEYERRVIGFFRSVLLNQ